MKKIVILEPYYGGSHKLFIDSLITNLPFVFELHSMPARNWKWRMRLAAPFFAQQAARGLIDLNDCLILCSTFLDVAAFKGLLPDKYKKVLIHTYFHENQFVYPVQVDDQRDLHFALTNLSTALASDYLAFNSSYNFNSFLQGCGKVLQVSTDMAIDYEEVIKTKSKILFPGLEFNEIDKQRISRVQKNNVPVILWNHRWEHDKNPDLFFRTLFKLQENQVDFKLVVIGESFKNKPDIFNEAKEVLADRIIQFGYVESRQDYIKWLTMSDIIVSTAFHEFFGISVIEAVRAGCRPLLPKRLSYPEIFPEEYLYEDEYFYQKLKNYLLDYRPKSDIYQNLTDSFSWSNLKQYYLEWFH